MELMSSLLLFALVAFMPQALGQSRRKFSHDNGYNDSLIIRRKMKSFGKNIIVNKPSHINKFKDLQSIFMDPDCRECYVCMQQAINANKPHMHMMDPRINSDSFQDDHNLIDISIRDKREATADNTIERKYKKSKSKKNNGVTVMKYIKKGKVYALKVKETNTVLDIYNNSKTMTTCEVYSIDKSCSCELPEANLILTESKKKKNKKSKKGYGKRETKKDEPKEIVEPIKNVEAIKPIIAPFYRKTNVDDFFYVEQLIMPSIEEMY